MASIVFNGYSYLLSVMIFNDLSMADIRVLLTTSNKANLQ